jgi:hypothetical protein
MRQRSIRSTHWSGHPDHPPPATRRRPARTLRGTTRETTQPTERSAPHPAKYEPPQHPAPLTATQPDVALQPDEVRNTTPGGGNATPTSTRFATPAPDSDATDSRTCGPQCGCNTITTSAIICALQGGRAPRCMLDAGDSYSSLEKSGRGSGCGVVRVVLGSGGSADIGARRGGVRSRYRHGSGHRRWGASWLAVTTDRWSISLPTSGSEPSWRW